MWFYRGAVTLQDFMAMQINNTPLTGLLWWLDRANSDIERRARRNG